MTESAINPKINDRYPYPGVDNDLQGFRDNFASIKSNLTIAKAEITDLLNNTAVVGNQPLNLNGHIVTNTIIKNSPTSRYTFDGLKRFSFDVDYLLGSYQSAYIGGDLTINFKNFPKDNLKSNQVGVLRLKLFSDASNRKVKFTATNAVIKYNSTFPFYDTDKLVIPGTVAHNSVILDIWQVSNGNLRPTVYIKYDDTFYPDH